MDLTNEINLRLAIIKEHGIIGFIKGYFKKIYNLLWIKTLGLRGNIVSVDNMKFYVGELVVSTETLIFLMNNHYERMERSAVQKFVDPSIPVIELGGFIGVVACYTNSILSAPEQHIVVEANPSAVPLLTRNRELNNCHFKIIHSAISYGMDPTVKFNLAELGSRINGNLTDQYVEVETLTLSNLVKSSGMEHFTLICDIEGTEVEVISNDINILAEQAVVIIMEIHTDFLENLVVENLLKQLDDAGFRIISLQDGTYVFENQNLKSDHS